MKTQLFSAIHYSAKRIVTLSMAETDPENSEKRPLLYEGNDIFYIETKATVDYTKKICFCEPKCKLNQLTLSWTIDNHFSTWKQQQV